jgi:hypothetical protein
LLQPLLYAHQNTFRENTIFVEKELRLERY